MSRSRPPREQLDLLSEIPPEPSLTAGSLAYAPELCGTLATAIKQSTLSRNEIAARMSDLTHESISIHQLNAWTAEAREGYRFPAEYLAAFEAATATHAVLELLARKRGCRVVVGRDVLTAELGAIEAQKTELRDRERQVRRMLDLHRPARR